MPFIAKWTNHLEDELEQLIDERLKQLLGEQTEEERERALRLANPHALFLIKVLLPYGARGLHRSYLIERVGRLEKEAGLTITPKFEMTLQRTFQSYSSQAAGFKGKTEDDIFWWPLGKGKGQMAVYANKVEAFLNKRKLDFTADE
jgi:hypothetical protein